MITNEVAKFCEQCGRTHTDTSKWFCARCGASLCRAMITAIAAIPLCKYCGGVVKLIDEEREE